jgi:hypothetical protein
MNVLMVYFFFDILSFLCILTLQRNLMDISVINVNLSCFCSAYNNSHESRPQIEVLKLASSLSLKCKLHNCATFE